MSIKFDGLSRIIDELVDAVDSYGKRLRRCGSARGLRTGGSFDAAMGHYAVQDDSAKVPSVGPAGKAAPRAKPIPVTSAVCNPAARTVTLTPSRRLDLHQYYRVTVKGTGIAGADGTLLDGTNTGKPGSDYVAVVHKYGTVAVTTTRAHPAFALRAANR